ncbi:MAG: hypothetical protein AAGC74_13265 [Verrucomicrobiota bacterium]
MKLLLTILIASLSPLPALTLSLVVSNDSLATVTYSIPSLTTPSSGAQANITYSGNILTDVTFDSSGNLSSIEFTGGNVATSNFTSNFSGDYFGSNYTFTIDGSNISRTSASSSPDPLNGGNLNHSLHSFSFNNGVIITDNSTSDPSFAFFTQQTILTTHNGAFIPSDFAFNQTQTNITSSVLSSTVFEKIVQVDFEAAINVGPVIPPYPIEVAGASSLIHLQFYQEFGTLNASGTINVETPFGTWVGDNNLDLADGTESNPAGIPYALIFALNLPVNTTCLPLTITSHPDPTVTLGLPTGGLLHNIDVEYSPDLITAFTPLPNPNFLNGTNSLNEGSTGTASFSFPSGTKGFLRFSVSL